MSDPEPHFWGMRRATLWLMYIFLLVAGNATLSGCRGAGDPGDAGTVAYGCPMKCEEEKTYEQPGNCPVCGMALVGVAADGTLVMPAPPGSGSDAGGR